MTLHSTLLESPRWPGGPPICPVVNLPALPSETALMAFLAKNGPRCEVISINHCPFCDHWHAETNAPNPSGDSSGTGRSHK